MGSMAGTKLEFIPSQVVSFRDFKATFPQGTVLGGDLLGGDYNPYSGYDTSYPFLFDDLADKRLLATERVVGVRSVSKVRAYPFQELAKDRVVHDTVGENSFVIFYEPAAISALGNIRISQARSVGAASVFVPRADGQDLTFEFIEGAFVDSQTESTWDILGQAVDGPLKGERLPPFFHIQAFWFYWAAISEETTIYESSQ